MRIRRTLKAYMYQYLLQVFFRLHRNLLQVRAMDITTQSRSRSGLVLAPHPDDEALGCGITILEKVEFGAKVRVVFATDGRHSHASKIISPEDLAKVRRQEALTSCKILGVPESEVTFLEYEDGNLSKHVDVLAKEILQLVVRHHPEEIFIPSAIDAHPDHRALNAAARCAVRASGSHPIVYEYPVWFWTARAWIDPEASFMKAVLQVAFRPLMALSELQPVVVRSRNCLARKREALQAHKSQTENLTGEAGWRLLDRELLDHLLSSNEMFFLRLEGAEERGSEVSLQAP